MNAIIPSFVLVLTQINMTEHLMPHVIAQSVVEIKCHIAFHLPQQVISVHSSLVHKRNEVWRGAFREILHHILIIFY